MNASSAQLAAERCNAGVQLIISERYDEAIAMLESATRLDPNLAEAHANLGQAYRRAGRQQEAMAASRAAIGLRANYLEAYLNLAVAALAAGALDQAVAANLGALAIDPDNAQATANLAGALHAGGDFAGAIAACERAIASRPEYAAAHANLGMSLLLTGAFARGWPEYAWLRRIPERAGFYPYAGRVPQWDGAPFPGRRLLVTREQGFGDAIQMARYVPAVKARGGTVILETPPALVELFATAGADAISVVESVGALRDDVDLHVPLMALPQIFGYDATSPQRSVPYLRADPARVLDWSHSLQVEKKLRVGLVWAGNPEHVHDRERSCAFEEFARLGKIEGIAWFSLQKGRDEMRTACGDAPMTPLGPAIADFSDTAAILAQLDLLIAVDTSVAHLAGALGRPVWMLLPEVPDWRWLLARRDSPWYPTMQLFRQSGRGLWEGVFEEVERALRALVAAKKDYPAINSSM